VTKLIASLADLLIRRENAVHRALRAEVATLVEHRRVDLGGREVHEARLVQHLEDLLCRSPDESVRGGDGRAVGRDPRHERPVVRRARDREHHARRHDADLRREEGDAAHEELPLLLSSSGTVGSVSPKSSETFFWTSQMICSFAFSALSRAISRSLAASFWASGSDVCAFGPRLLALQGCELAGAHAHSRHSIRCDE
jgi:hypothetical protein